MLIYYLMQISRECLKDRPICSKKATAVVAVPAAARLEVSAKCTKCVFDAYCGQFDIEECKGQIPAHIANTNNSGLE